MSLRARLTLAFVVAVLLPVVLATVVVAVVLPSSARNHVDSQVASARAQVETALQQVCQTQQARAGALAATTGDLDQAATAASADVGSAAVVQDAGGTTVVSAGRAGAANTALIALLPTAPDCSSGGAQGVGGPRVVAARVDRPGGGVVVVGRALDPSVAGGSRQALLPQLAASTGAAVTLTFPADLQLPTASSLADSGTATKLAARALAENAPASVAHADGQTFAVLPLQGGARVVVSHGDPETATIVLVVVLVGLLLLVVAGLVGWRLARTVTRPLVRLSEAAERVTEGDLDFRLPTHRDDEVSRLSTAFNTMTEALRRTITDLRTSRDELQRNVSRLGDTLSSTHDLDRILGVIVDTAMVSVRATAGALLLTSADGSTLYLRVGRGVDARLPRLPAGASAQNRPVRNAWTEGAPGVASRVARTGQAVRGTVSTDLDVAPDEPQGGHLMALPLRSGGRVTGVLALYDRSDGQPFDQRDEQIVDSFVAQAVTAVDNVLLHQEAQRLSITDGLTGLWNYRYVVLALAREVERASRFDRPLAVLMLDLDRFKRVNDRYGHQRGDAVLLEVANRVRTVVREVDILARYGGEELILVLPETDLAGAEFLADRVRDAIRSSPVGGPGEEPLTMTASLGVAVFPHHGGSAREILRAADAALYAAKAAGRDCYRIAGQQPDAPVGRPLQVGR